MGADCTLEGRGLSTTGAISVYGVTAFVPGIILPVSLMEFKATKSGNAIELTWISADEYNLGSYQVERSNDGRNFNNIGTTAPTNTPFITNYKWIDYSPLSTISFYRLKMIDIGHVYKYSPIVRIDMNNRKNIAVYPNPVTGNTIMLQMYGQPRGEYTLSLFHTKGDQLLSRSIVHDGKDAVRSVSLNKNFPSGFYFLHISNASGNNVVLKIMIQ
jgi:hypothetical protein